VQALDPSDPAGLAELLARLADPSWRVRGAAVERVTAHPRPVEVLPAVLDLLVAPGPPGARIAAAAAMARLGPAAVPLLLPRLASDRPEVRCACADVLGEIGDRRGALALADRIADPDPNVRLAAAEALGKIGGTWAAGALLGALDAGDAALRIAALEALDRIGAAPPAARLEPLLEDRGARRSALRLLGRSDDPAAADLLARGAAETSRGAREAAYAGVARRASRRDPASLARLAEAVAAQAARTPSVAPWAEEGLRAEDPLAAEGAVRVLGWSGDPSRAPALAAAAEDEALRPAVQEALESLGARAAEALEGAAARLSPPARLVVHAALARAGRPGAVPELAAAAGDPARRAAAVEALGRSGQGAAAAALVPLLDHPEPDVAGLAAAALVELARGSGALRAEVLAWARPAGEARIPAALLRLLGEAGDAADLPLVRRGLRDPRPATRAASARALGALAARGAVEAPPPEALDAIDDPQPAVRAAAAEALGELGARCAAPPGGDCTRALGVALRDAVPAVRAAAARAVGRVGLVRHAGPLEALAAGPDPGAAAAAVEALARLGAARLEVLAGAARAADVEVVKAALSAAARIPGPEARALLVEALADPRWDVRRAAARGAEARGDPALADAVRDLAGVEADPVVAEALAGALRALGG
jgi:HEAT repeat protein